MQKLTPLSGEKGSALVFALVFGIVLAIMGVAALELVSGGSSGSARDIAVIKSFWANEGAIHVSLRYLECVSTLPTANFSPSFTPKLILNNDTPQVTVSVVTSGICYSCSSSTPMSAVNLSNNTAYDNFSAYGYCRFTRFEEQTSGDVWELSIINGDFHTNGYMNLALQMTDSVHVTGQATASGRVHSGNSQDADFPPPYNFGIRIYDNVKDVEVDTETMPWFQPRIPNYAFLEDSVPTSVVAYYSLPSFGTALTISTSSSIDTVGVYLNGTNVTVWNHNTSTGWSQTSYALSNITGGILKTQKPTYVWGTLNGALTILTDTAATGAVNNDIIVGANIMYSNTNLSTSTNVLGLVSSNNLVINPKDSNATLGMIHNFTTSGATIYGSIFLTDGQLEVTDTNAYSSLQNLNIYGGMLVKNQSRGTVNSSDHGLAAIYYQDPRFVSNTIAPPGVPRVVLSADPELPGSYFYLFGKGTWANSVITL
jgi:hypothetical protein